MRRTAAAAAILWLVAALAIPALALAQDATDPQSTLEGPPASSSRKRVSYDGKLPPGWKYGDLPADRAGFAGLRIEKKMATDRTDMMPGHGVVEAMHNWWQNYKTLDDYLTNAQSAIDAQRDSAAAQQTLAGGGEFRGNKGKIAMAGQEFAYYEFYDQPMQVAFNAQPRTFKEYYTNLPDGTAITVRVIATGGTEEEYAALLSEAEEIFRDLKFDFGIDSDEEDADRAGRKPAGGLPWKTAGAGAAAVAAAAAALAGAVASGRGKKKKLDPHEHVGYVLELSTQRIELTSANSHTLSVRVWKVLASGAVEPADDATVTLRPPPGVQVSPASGGSPLEAAVWQDGEVDGGARLTVEAKAAKGATRAAVDLVPEAASELTLTLEPEGRGAIKPNGKDVARVVATLKLGVTAQADPNVDAEAVRGSIKFARPSSDAWLDVGEEVDVPNGKAIPIAASPPDPDHPGEPPEAVTVTATAQLGAQTLTGSLAVPLERPPSIDCRPDVVEFAAGAGDAVEVLVWIDDPGGLEWAFTSKWRDGSRPLATTEIRHETASTAVVTVTEDAGKLPDTGQPQEASTLVLVGNAEGWDPLERYLKVIVTREGIFIDPVGRARDGTFHIEARGESKPTDIDVRVYVRDESGAIHPDADLAQAVAWTPGGPDKSPGRAALGFPEFSLTPEGLRGVENPSATFRAVMGRRLPTGPEPLAAILHASVPGFDKPQYSTDVALRFLGVDTSPYSDEWKLERDRCLEIIAEFAPYEHQQKFRDLVYERGKLMGAEGLYEMRKRIWSISENALRKEAEDYLTTAWYIEQVEGVLDWMSYLGDIAFAVASGRVVGTVGAIGLGLLKPMLVSAMTAYVDGKDLTWWAKQQIVLGIGIVEGQWTDPDFVAHLTGRNKAVVWIAFICYTCVKEWALDPEHSIKNAMLNTLRMLRDQAIISFLRMVTGATPGAAKPGAEAPPPPKGAKPPAPKSTRKPPAPGSVVKPGQKPARTPPKPGSVSKAPKKPGAPGATGAEPAAAGSGAKPKATRKPPAPGSVAKPGPGAEKQQPRAKPAKLAPEFDGPDPKVRAEKMGKGVRDKMKPGPDGKPRVDTETMEKIMRDPDAARELRQNDPEAWKAYDRARQDAYKQHDAELSKWIQDNVPEAKGKKIEVETFGTPDGVDRDYRAGIVLTDPKTGKQTFIEIPKEKWADKSQQIFSEKTGGPSDPAKAAEWSRQRQQLPTDGYHAEASVDMSDQVWVKNDKTGRFEKTQGTSNLAMVKKGKSTLMDPDGLGKTYETKVAESYHDGNKLDAYKQAEKATHSFTEVKTGYMAQDYKMRQTPPEMVKAFQIIEKVASGDMKPDAGDSALRDLGVGDNLPDFMGKLSGQFAGFKFAKK